MHLALGPTVAARAPMLRFPFVVASTLTCLSVAGCGIASFPYGYDIAEQRVPGSPLGPVLGGTLIDIPLNIDLSAETAARGTGPAQHVYLTDFTLSVTGTDEPSGDSDDLAFISSIEIYVESTQAGSSLPRMRVAHLEGVAAGARAISLHTDGVDLIGYVREGAHLSASATGHAPPDDVSYDGHLDFAIQVL
jgi:hypothetical protein